MMADSKIEWTEKTWNPVTGCSPVSEGCAHCYAKRMVYRIVAMEKGRLAKNPNTKLSGYPHDDPFRVTFHPDKLNEPLHWKKPRRVFVCSMGDLFHEDVPDRKIISVLNVAATCSPHIFMFLTKRPDRMGEVVALWQCGMYATLNRNNMYFGVSVENQRTADERIPILLQIPAAVRFVSVEPMLEAINIIDRPWWDWRYTYEYFRIAYPDAGPPINWVICGGKSGPGRRPFKLEWARDLRDQCKAASVPFFFKQTDKVTPIPDDLMIREWPR